MADGRWLGKLCGKVHVIVELTFKLECQQSPPNHQMFCDDTMRWLSTKQADEMPDGYRVKEQREKQQPTPQWQTTIWPLPKNPVRTSFMSNTKDEEIAPQPNRPEKPATLRQPKHDENDAQKGKNVSVAHGMLSCLATPELSRAGPVANANLHQILRHRPSLPDACF
jgi:hypothetical protein